MVGWNAERGCYLVVAPHPDDAELAMGATIARMVDDGADVTILMLSDRGEPTWLDEARAAATILGEGVVVVTLHLSVFDMWMERQALLRHLEHYRDTLTPDAVFVPAAGDLHQDHATCLAEARRAFRGRTLLTYEIIRSNYGFHPMVFAPVTDDHMDRKVRSVACYSTQRDKLYCQPEAIAGLARVRGAMCDQPLAEAFGVEWICC